MGVCKSPYKERKPPDSQVGQQILHNSPRCLPHTQTISHSLRTPNKPLCTLHAPTTSICSLSPPSYTSQLTLGSDLKLVVGNWRAIKSKTASTSRSNTIYSRQTQCFVSCTNQKILSLARNCLLKIWLKKVLRRRRRLISRILRYHSTREWAMIA